MTGNEPMTDPTLPGRARRAAEAIHDVYRALGGHADDYDHVLFTKEWLINAADTLQALPRDEWAEHASNP